MPPVRPTCPCPPRYPSALEGESDDDYNPQADSEMVGHGPKRRGPPKLLSREQRVLCRTLYSHHNCAPKDLAKLFGITATTIGRTVRNIYAPGFEDNLDSDAEYIQSTDVMQALDELRGLHVRPQIRPLVQSATQSKREPETGASVPSTRTGSSETQHNEQTDPGSSASAPKTRLSGTQDNEQVAGAPLDKQKIHQFLVDIRFTESEISAILPRLRDGGITDDKTFSEILTQLPDCDIEQLLKEFEEKRYLTTVQRIRIRRGILNQRA